MRYFLSLFLPSGDATVYRPSVCPSVTFRYRDHIGWNTSKIISPPNSDKIVRWRFLRNRRWLLRLHTIFRALIILGASRGHLSDFLVAIGRIRRYTVCCKHVVQYIRRDCE